MREITVNGQKSCLAVQHRDSFLSTHPICKQKRFKHLTVEGGVFVEGFLHLYDRCVRRSLWFRNVGNVSKIVGYNKSSRVLQGQNRQIKVLQFRKNVNSSNTVYVNFKSKNTEIILIQFFIGSNEHRWIDLMEKTTLQLQLQVSVLYYNKTEDDVNYVNYSKQCAMYIQRHWTNTKTSRQTQNLDISERNTKGQLCTRQHTCLVWPGWKTKSLER